MKNLLPLALVAGGVYVLSQKQPASKQSSGSQNGGLNLVNALTGFQYSQPQALRMMAPRNVSIAQARPMLVNSDDMMTKPEPQMVRSMSNLSPRPINSIIGDIQATVQSQQNCGPVPKLADFGYSADGYAKYLDVLSQYNECQSKIGGNFVKPERMPPQKTPDVNVMVPPVSIQTPPPQQDQTDCKCNTGDKAVNQLPQRPTINNFLGSLVDSCGTGLCNISSNYKNVRTYEGRSFK